MTESDVFRNMADKIDRNPGTDFGGALVIAPPEGRQVEILILDARKDALHFWTQIKTVVDVEINRLMIEEKQKQSFGRTF